jgi:type I restriction enzyme R subunit
VNGLPVATCELKNPGTGQNWRHAVRQYQKDRDPRAPLFDFKKRAWCTSPPTRTKCTWPPGWRRENTSSCPSTAAAIRARSVRRGQPAARQRLPHRLLLGGNIQRDSFLDILGHFMFIEKRRRRWTTARAASGGHQGDR